MAKINNLSEVIAGWSLAILAITRSLAVMHGDSTLGSPAISLLLYIVTYVCLLCLLPCVIRRINLVHLKSSVLLAICVTLYTFISLVHSYKGDAGLNVVLFVIMLCFCFSDNTVKLLAFRIFKAFLLVTSVLGIIAYISYIFSLGIPFKMVPFYDTDFYTYVDFKFSYLIVSIVSVRLCGLFNEPGYLGTILGLVLIANGLNLKKLENIVFLLAGGMTLSLAFYILVIIGFLYNGFHGKRTFIVLLLGSTVLALVLPKLVETFPVVEAIVERFSFEDGRWVGDNRSSNSLDNIYEQMLKSDNWAFGYGSGYTSYFEDSGLTSSYKGFFIDYGIVGALILYGLLFVAAMALVRSFKELNIRKQSYFFIFCFFLNIYQRPYVISIVYLLVLFGGLLYCDSNNYQQSILKKSIQKKINEK